MSSLPARMKKIQLKMKALELPHHCSYYKSMMVFLVSQGQLTLWSDLANLRTHPRCNGFSCYLQEEDPITNEGARVTTKLNIDFPYAQGQLTL